MFERLEPAAPDPILGLAEAFKKDSNPDKINLTVGVYKDDDGATPIMRTVKKAEEAILRDEKTKSYLPIDGSPEYAALCRELLFPAGHEILESGRSVTAHTPGGTAALRVAAEFVKGVSPEATVWMSEPTWPNHPSVFAAAGLATKTYPYFDPTTNGLDFSAMRQALMRIPRGDVLLLHGCCHNPTGVDPDPDRWKSIAATAKDRGLLPVVDFAYQGLGDGIAEDGAGFHELCFRGCELLIASSFSKNFGLYNERAGALTVVGKSAEEAEISLGHIKSHIRANYSNPPWHGAAVVTTVLGSSELRTEWEGEVAEMRKRIAGMRDLFVETLKAKGVKRDFSFLKDQRGMFSFSGLTKEQVQKLRNDYSIYIVGSGRINVAGMTTKNMDRLCQAIAEVL